MVPLCPALDENLYTHIPVTSDMCVCLYGTKGKMGPFKSSLTPRSFLTKLLNTAM